MIDSAYHNIYVFDLCSDHSISSRMQSIPGARVINIQFQDRNVMHGARNFDNRWIVRVVPIEAYNYLLQSGVEICNRRISIRPYYDVLSDEYKEYLEYVRMQEQFMFDKIRDLTGSMPSQALSIIQEATAGILADPNKLDEIVDEDEGVEGETSSSEDEDSESRQNYGEYSYIN